jgi:hypothetical protein
MYYEQTLAFFDERQPSIRLNPSKCKSPGRPVAVAIEAKEVHHTT